MQKLDLNKKIDTIENELVSLKTLILQLSQIKPKKVISIKGILSGISINEEEIHQSKKSLFRIGA